MNEEMRNKVFEKAKEKLAEILEECYRDLLKGRFHKLGKNETVNRQQIAYWISDFVNVSLDLVFFIKQSLIVFDADMCKKFGKIEPSITELVNRVVVYQDPEKRIYSKYVI